VLACGSLGAEAATEPASGVTRPAATGESVSFDLFFESRDLAGLESLVAAQSTPGNAQYGHFLKPADVAARFGADPAQLAKAATMMHAAGLTVVKTNPFGLVLSGSVGAVQARFGMALDHATIEGKDQLVLHAGFTMPAELAAMGAKMVAFSRNRFHTHSRQVGKPIPTNQMSPLGPYFFDDLKQAYDAPSFQALSGTGSSIAILIGSDVQDQDIAEYFGLRGLPEPFVEHIAINGGATFSTSNDNSLEAELDVEQSGGMAPNAAILLYNIPALDNGDVIDGLVQIIEDNAADVVSMSFGECELFFTPAFNGGTDFSSTVQVMHQLFLQGNAQGITFVASSGDGGALGCVSATKPIFVEGAENPASDTAITAVGGTNLVTAFNKNSKNSAYVTENANGDPLVPNDPVGAGVNFSGGIWGSGGGPSIFFARPAYQNLVPTGTNARAVPDLSLHMGGCPGDAILPCGPDRSADLEIFNGEAVGVIGTSASAPDIAGSIALLRQLSGVRHGNINTLFYSLAARQAKLLGGGAFRRDITGFNGVFHSGGPVPTSGVTVPTLPLYNMVLGLGTADIRQLIGAAQFPSAGVPETPSNP
jgi:subtilase family serine protease